MTCRLILSIPVGSSVEALTEAQRDAIRGVRGRWKEGGMPGTYPAGGRYLIDVLTDVEVTRAMLDALGLPLWLIVGCWYWDEVTPAVVTVEPLDTVLYLPHLPVPVDPETGLPTGAPALTDPHVWTGWPPCIPEESST